MIKVIIIGAAIVIVIGLIVWSTVVVNRINQAIDDIREPQPGDQIEE